MAAFNIPLNLPHACTIGARIEYHLRARIPLMDPEHRELLQMTSDLLALLAPYNQSGENPSDLEEAKRVTLDAAILGRRIVDGIEKLSLGGDRLGQCIRNLFECLELGEEGAEISLRAGENKNSLMRPT